MRPSLAFFVLLVGLTALLPLAHAAGPTPMSFNGQPSSDVRGAVNSASMDGTGRYGAVALADAGVTLPEDPDLSVFNLQGSGGKAWDANDRDLVNEGAKVVKVANGSSGAAGNWLVLVNATAAGSSNVVSAYQTSGGCSPCDVKWQYTQASGIVNDLDITGDGHLVGVATGAGVSTNSSYILLRNNFSNQNPLPLELFRVNALSNPDADISTIDKFTSVALSSNSSIPGSGDATRAVYSVVGAETTTTSGVRGMLLLYRTEFSNDLDHPPTLLLQKVLTDSAITKVAITADGDYAVAGTQGGQVYLLSIAAALGPHGLQVQPDPLRPWQQGVGSTVNSVAIAAFGYGPVFSAGTSDGTVILFRNDQSPQGSDGARGVEVGRANVNTPLCTPALHAPVSTLSFTDAGDQLVVGAQDGLLQFDAVAFTQVQGATFAPAWCVPFDSAHSGNNGVKADISGDGKRVFAGSSHYVFGYTNLYKLSVDAGNQGTAITGLPGSRVQWAFTVRNDGSLFDRANLTISGPTEPGWSFELSNRSLALFPGQAQVVLVNVTTPANLAPGNFTLTFSVQSQRNTETSGKVDLPLRLNLAQLRRVELRPPTGTLIASAGTQNSFPITIHNGGNADDRFRITAAIPEPQAQFKSPGSDWQIRPDPTVVAVPANSDATFNLLVTPSAQRGDTAVIQVDVAPDVASPGSEGVTDSRQLQIAVEPSFNGDVALAENKDYRVFPGQSIFVNFTVKNLGNTRDLFTVKNFTDPSNAPGWRLQLADQTFELRKQGDVHIVRMTVTAQAGLQPGDNVRILLDLFSDGLAKQTPGSDGKVDEQSLTVTVVPQPKPKFLGIPGAPEPLVLLGVVAAAVALGGARASKPLTREGTPPAGRRSERRRRGA